MTPFPGLELGERLDVLGDLASIEARRGPGVTFVVPTAAMIDLVLAGRTDLAAFEDDLRAITARAAADHELPLREVRRAGRWPVAVFAAYQGWPLRDLVHRVRCSTPTAATIALAIARSYGATDVGDVGDVATAATRDGRLIRQVVPRFRHVADSEAPSFTGLEPTMSARARIAEGRATLATMSGLTTSTDHDAETPAAEARFIAELELLADRAGAERELATLLASRA